MCDNGGYVLNTSSGLSLRVCVFLLFIYDEKEKEVIHAYRTKENLRAVIDKLLDIK